MDRYFERKIDLTPMDGSKLTKRATQPEIHGRVAKPGFQPVGKFSADESASHHVKAQQKASDSQLERTHLPTNIVKNTTKRTTTHDKQHGTSQRRKAMKFAPARTSDRFDATNLSRFAMSERKSRKFENRDFHHCCTPGAGQW